MRRKSANDSPPTEDVEMKVPKQNRSLFPDMIYATRAYTISEERFIDSKALPAIRNLASRDLYPSYLLMEFKPTSAQRAQAKQPTAVLAATLLLERLKLRLMVGNADYQDLCIFIITCCGEYVKIWKMSTANQEKDLNRSIGYRMHLMKEHNISQILSLKKLCQRINQIHLFGLTTHKSNILTDQDAYFHRQAQFNLQ